MARNDVARNGDHISLDSNSQSDDHLDHLETQFYTKKFEKHFTSLNEFFQWIIEKTNIENQIDFINQ